VDGRQWSEAVPKHGGADMVSTVADCGTEKFSVAGAGVSSGSPSVFFFHQRSYLTYATLILSLVNYLGKVTPTTQFLGIYRYPLSNNIGMCVSFVPFHFLMCVVSKRKYCDGEKY
jgi:hypothetical protein